MTKQESVAHPQDPQARRWRFVLPSVLALFLAWALFAAPTAFARSVQQDGNVVQVTLVDGAIEMPAELPAGPTTFAVVNAGVFEHDFQIEGQGIDQKLESTLDPGETGSLQVDLQPGAYRVYCPVADHAAHGMDMTLTVTAAQGAETPAPEEEPVATDTPAAEEEPAATETPAAEEEPLATETPAAEEEPVATDTPAAEEEPAATETPAAEEEPLATETPAAEEEPAAAETPAAEEEPAAAETPAPAEQPAAGTVAPGGSLPGDPAIALVKVADGLADPVNVAAPPDGSGRLFIVERIGRIRILQDGQLLPEPFLDITNIVKTDFLEQGLLGLAFHPDYAENGRFFVDYVDWRTNGDTHVVEYTVSDDPNVADPESARVIFSQDQPFVNHNGGTIHFGPDGYLYVAMGDGGLAGDPYRNAQSLDTLLGKILRLDVDAAAPAYGIPADNPFTRGVVPSSGASQAAQGGGYLPAARPEIWAYGLRNPWQFSFDSATGDLYIADVGQNEWEEINVQPAGAAGWNFGWPFLEASHCYLPGSACGPIGVQPVAEYAHGEDNCSITGVGVYRGQRSAALDGIYFASDYCSGKFWGLARDGSDAWAFAELLDTGLQVSGAGSDEAGELYVTSCTCEFQRGYDPEAELGGAVWQLMAADQVPDGAETAP